jgi:hypothetical protein
MIFHPCYFFAFYRKSVASLLTDEDVNDGKVAMRHIGVLRRIKRVDQQTGIDIGLAEDLSNSDPSASSLHQTILWWSDQGVYDLIRTKRHGFLFM